MQIEGIFRRQSGVISRDQALAAGISAGQIRQRLATGRWLPVHPRVYRVADREYTDEARVRAAALWAGESATITGVAAAWWHGLCLAAPSIVDVTVPAGRRPRTRPGVRILRRDLAEADRVGLRGLWVTDVPLSVLEAAVKFGAQVVDRALQRRVRFDALHRAHCRNLGRRGSAAAGQLLIAEIRAALS